MKSPLSRKASEPAAPISGPAMLDALDRKIAAIEERDRRLADQDRAITKSGGGGGGGSAADAVTVEAVRAVLAGNPFVPIGAPPISRLAAIAQERAVLGAAIRALKDEKYRAHIAHGAEVYTARLAELRGLMRETADCIGKMRDLDRRRLEFRNALMAESLGVSNAFPGFAALPLVRERMIGIVEDFERAAIATGLLTEKEISR